MKKLRILVLAGLVSLTIAGCKSTNDNYCEYCGEDKSGGSISVDGTNPSMESEVNWLNDTFNNCPRCVTIELLNYTGYSELNEQLYMNHISNCSAPHNPYHVELPGTDLSAEELNNLKCENCNNDVSDYVDSCGSYMCDRCGFIK